MMSLDYILPETICFLGSYVDGKAYGVAWVEQSVTALVGKVVEAIKLEHCCIGAFTPRAVHSIEVWQSIWLK